MGVSRSGRGPLAGCKKKRARIQALQAAPPHSWLHASHYSVGNPQSVVYLLCTPHGPITANEEYFCWVYALTGRLRMARRMCFTGNVKRAPSPKELARVADLIDMHNKAVIDLTIGPWEYYGLPIGDPTRYIKPAPKDYSKCLTPLNTFRQSM